MMAAQLVPHIETMFLLVQCPWGEEEKKKAIEGLNKFGLSGTDFYNRHFRLMEQYYQTFERYRIDSPGAVFLQEMEDITITICADVFYRNPDFWTPDSITEEAARAAIERTLYTKNANECENNGDLFDELEAQPFTDRVKWQLVLLQHKAARQLKLIASAVAENLPAFEKARKKVEHELNRLLQRFQDCSEMSEKPQLLRLSEELNEDTVIIPTLALPLIVLISDDVCFYGLMNEKIAAGNIALSMEDMLMCSKMLSDKSKLEILVQLKEHSRYNLEIAELIGLTPATVSHHMNTLLASGFVALERRDGKVYYRLAAEGIKKYIEGVERLLIS